MASMIKDAVTVLHGRLKQLTPEASAEQLAYLAKSIESIGGQGTLLDIVALTDEKLIELANKAAEHVATLNTTKSKAVTDLNTAKKNHLSALENARSTHVAAVKSAGDNEIAAMEQLTNRFDTVNDVPDNSSIMAEIANNLAIEKDSLPLLMGVLSRSGDHFGVGGFTTQLGQWHSDVTKTNAMLELLTGCHDHATQYVGFYKPPQLYFAQGKKGTFVYKELLERYAVSSNIYQYPHAILGTLFVKNPSDKDISGTLFFGGACRWSSKYEGAGLFLGTPNQTNSNKSSINNITWANLYSHTANINNFSANTSLVVPADKTVALLLYTSAFHYTGNYNRYCHFLQWHVHTLRNGLLSKGLTIDHERTLRAWQCPGLQHTYQLWQ